MSHLFSINHTSAADFVSQITFSARLARLALCVLLCFVTLSSYGGGNQDGRHSHSDFYSHSKTESDAANVVKENEPTNPELRKLYDHYPRGSRQFEATCFLLAGLPGKISNDDREQLKTYLGVIDSMAMATAKNVSVVDQYATTQAAGKRSNRTNIIPDIEVLNADSLTRSIDAAFEAWNAAPWREQYTFADFLEYVLPYRVLTEPLEYYWRWDALRRFRVPESDNTQRLKAADGDSIQRLKAPAGDDLPKDGDLLAVARQINSAVSYKGDPLFRQSGTGLQGYSMMLRSGMGKCDDRAVLVAMAMRAHGIPAAYDFIPQWGCTASGHSFCSIILPNGSSVAFQEPDDDGENVILVQKAPKIYRRMYSEQRSTILYRMKDKEPIPPLFSSFDLMDVTKTHTTAVGFADLKAAIPSSVTNKIVYLGVFSIYGWTLLAYTENKGRGTVFPDMGTGTDANGGENFRGENIGRGILYMPCIYDGAVKAVAPPVIHSPEGTRTITANASHTERVVLRRKFPRLQRIVNYAYDMVGGVFEGANRPDFSDAVELHYISETPLSRMQRVEVESSKPFHYFRYRKPRGTFALGEMKVFDNKGQELKGKIIAYSLFAGDKELPKIADGDPLTFFSVMGMLDGWAGFDFGRPVSVGAIEFCPRTDDNDISPGDRYELFWWDDSSGKASVFAGGTAGATRYNASGKGVALNGTTASGQATAASTTPAGWTSLGIQTAVGYELTYDNVPIGALLWLRDLTRGHEERPFTWENGRQMWW